MVCKSTCNQNVFTFTNFFSSKSFRAEIYFVPPIINCKRNDVVDVQRSKKKRKNKKNMMAIDNKKLKS